MTEIGGGAAAMPADGHEAGQSERILVFENRSKILPMLWIGFYTTILSFLTLSIFRFWGRTQFRRRLWADTRVDGEALEYTGRGSELFLGALLAIVTVLAPLLLIVIAAQAFLHGVLILAVLVPLYLGFYVIVGAALFLARRYHLSRTTYRGLRLVQTGSALAFGWRFLGYLLLTLITFGWFGPVMRIRLSRAMWSQAFYGDRQFAFQPDETALRQPVYRSFALLWVGALILYIAFFAVAGHLHALPTPANTGDIAAIGKLYLILLPLLIGVALLSCWHEAAITRRISGSIVLDDLRLSSRISTWDFIGVFLSNLVLVIVTLGFGAMAAQMRNWRLYANRLSAQGRIDFAQIRQNADRGPRHGEGMADGLDLVSLF